MTRKKRALVLLGAALSVGSTALGLYGIWGRGVRAVDFVAIFGGGVASAATVFGLFHRGGDGPAADAPPAPSKQKSSG